MDLLESLRIALQSLRANALRSALTLVGMIIGVFAIIASVTAVQVIDVFFQERLSILGSGAFSVSRYAAQINGGDEDRAYHRPITWEQTERLMRRIGTTMTVAPMEDFEWTARATYAGRQTDPRIMLMGTNEHLLRNFGYSLAQGRGFSEADVRYGRPLTILGAAIAEELFPNETPLGKQIRIGPHQYEVVGVLEEQGAFFGYTPDTRAYAPITLLLNRYGDGGRNIADISVRAPDPMMMAASMEEVMGAMRVIRKVPPGEDNDFALDTNDSIQGLFDRFTGALTMGGAGIGFIALLAAGIGIMNIMLVSVTERTREIGVRKSVGARPRDILAQFLFEAIVLCQIGGLLGIALGALGGNVLALYFGISAAFPWAWALGGVAGVTFVALVFGAYPAWRAARLDPIEALRWE